MYLEAISKDYFEIAFIHNFIRMGLTRAKALQTATRFPGETRRRFAVPKLTTTRITYRDRTVNNSSIDGCNNRFDAYIDYLAVIRQKSGSRGPGFFYD